MRWIFWITIRTAGESCFAFDQTLFVDGSDKNLIVFSTSSSSDALLGIAHDLPKRSSNFVLVLISLSAQPIWGFSAEPICPAVTSTREMKLPRSQSTTQRPRRYTELLPRRHERVYPTSSHNLPKNTTDGCAEFLDKDSRFGP